MAIFSIFGLFFRFHAPEDHKCLVRLKIGSIGCGWLSEWFENFVRCKNSCFSGLTNDGFEQKISRVTDLVSKSQDGSEMTSQGLELKIQEICDDLSSEKMKFDEIQKRVEEFVDLVVKLERKQKETQDSILGNFWISVERGITAMCLPLTFQAFIPRHFLALSMEIPEGCQFYSVRVCDGHLVQIFPAHGAQIFFDGDTGISEGSESVEAKFSDLEQRFEMLDERGMKIGADVRSVAHTLNQKIDKTVDGIMGNLSEIEEELVKNE